MEELPQEMQAPAPQLTGEAPMDAMPGEGMPIPGEGMPMPGGESPMPGPGVEMVGEDKKQELLAIIEDIKGKMGEANASAFASENMFNVKKSEAVEQVFNILQEAGVDLSNPESVNMFLEKLREENPDMAILFEEALDQLFGSEDIGEGESLGDEEEMGGAQAEAEELLGPTPGGPGAVGPSGPGDLKNLNPMQQNENLQEGLRGPLPQ